MKVDSPHLVSICNRVPLQWFWDQEERFLLLKQFFVTLILMTKFSQYNQNLIERLFVELTFNSLCPCFYTRNCSKCFKPLNHYIFLKLSMSYCFLINLVHNDHSYSSKCIKKIFLSKLKKKSFYFETNFTIINRNYRHLITNKLIKFKCVFL